jgi:colanic acid biosynthesis protein WcaH
MLKPDKYLKVIETTTLTSIDIVFHHNGKILLGLRNNNPAKGYLFTIGVRTGKLETLDMGIKRVGAEELGIDVDPKKAILLGAYDHIYPNNFRNEDFGTHYVVNAYLLELSNDQINNIKIDSQHSKLEWIPLVEMKNHTKIHYLVKNYLPAIEKWFKK